MGILEKNDYFLVIFLYMLFFFLNSMFKKWEPQLDHVIKGFVI